MNKLIIGLADKTAKIAPSKPGFLLIDDGPIANAFLQTFKRVKQFDPHSHSFNPLRWRSPGAPFNPSFRVCVVPQLCDLDECALPFWAFQSRRLRFPLT
jgi:hypothetical protein